MKIEMDKETIEKIKRQIKEKSEKDHKRKIDRFFRMDTLNDPDDVPEIPIIKDKDEYRKVVVDNLIRCGAVPKDKLEIGKTYLGSCRNATQATWNGTVFEYKRYKFGDWFDDTINHFEDDDGYDLFVPIRKIENQ